MEQEVLNARKVNFINLCEKCLECLKTTNAGLLHKSISLAMKPEIDENLQISGFGSLNEFDFISLCLL
jgi:hypothetical protein